MLFIFLKMIIIVILFTFSERGFAHSTRASVFTAFGQFNDTSEEKSSSFEGLGVSMEVQKINSNWNFKGDYFSTQRKTQSGNLVVQNSYRELKLWAQYFFPLDSYFSVYGGAGLGALSILTQMKVKNYEKKLESEAELLAAYILGLRLGFPSGLFFDFFRQSTYGPSYPGYNLSFFAFQIGYQF